MSERPSLLRRLLVLPIVFYRRFLSRLKPPMCRFHPTCSTYAHDAILTHGVLRGSALAIWRILRCQPFAKGGYDPVPPRRGRRAGDPPARTEQDPQEPAVPPEADRDELT